MIDFLTPTTIVNGDIKRTTDSNHYFLAGTVGMTTTPLTRGHIVSPVDAGDVERDIFILFGNSQIASRVDNLRQVNESCFHTFFVFPGGRLTLERSFYLSFA